MVQKSHGKMHRTRKKITKIKRKSITSYVSSFKIGDKVIVEINATSKFPHPVFNGQVGVIVSKKGRAYEITVKNMKNEKTIAIKPEHIRKL